MIVERAIAYLKTRNLPHSTHKTIMTLARWSPSTRDIIAGIRQRNIRSQHVLLMIAKKVRCLVSLNE